MIASPWALASFKARAILVGLVVAAVLAVVAWALIRASAAETRAAKAGEGLAAVKAQTASEAALASENAREREQLANRANAKVNDALQSERRAGAAERAAVDRRLRERTEELRADAASGAACTTAGAGQQLDAAPLACLSDQARSDLVGLASDANDTVRDLTACQQYVRTVVPLCSEPLASAGLD